jgi:hypothetical protein
MKHTQTELHSDIKIRVVAINKANPNKTIEKIMTFGEWKILDKKREFNYLAYQLYKFNTFTT